MPDGEREHALRRHPHLIDGVVLNNPEQLDRARTVLHEARLLPRSVVAIGSTASFRQPESVAGRPVWSSWFHRTRPCTTRSWPRRNGSPLLAGQGERDARLAALERQITLDRRLGDRLGAVAADYPPGAIAGLEAERDEVEAAQRTAVEHVAGARATAERCDGGAGAGRAGAVAARGGGPGPPASRASGRRRRRGGRDSAVHQRDRGGAAERRRSRRDRGGRPERGRAVAPDEGGDRPAGRRPEAGGRRFAGRRSRTSPAADPRAPQIPRRCRWRPCGWPIGRQPRRTPRWRSARICGPSSRPRSRARPRPEPQSEALKPDDRDGAGRLLATPDGADAGPGRPPSSGRPRRGPPRPAGQHG